MVAKAKGWFTQPGRRQNYAGDRLMGLTHSAKRSLPVINAATARGGCGTAGAATETMGRASVLGGKQPCGYS
jgi:hypothetical protein